MMPPPRKTIAIVDDNTTLRHGLERYLRAAGYRCESFANAEDFLEVATGLGAACLLADVHLQAMSGLELALHPEVTELHLPVLIMTGSDDPLIEVAARDISSAFLRKPFGCKLLLDAIVDTIGPPIAEGEV
jgi:FixJ family two-component response regulator